MRSGGSSTPGPARGLRSRAGPGELTPKGLDEMMAPLTIGDLVETGVRCTRSYDVGHIMMRGNNHGEWLVRWRSRGELWADENTLRPADRYAREQAEYTSGT